MRTVEMVSRELSDFFSGHGWPGASAPLRQRALALVGFMVKDAAAPRMMMRLAVEADETRWCAGSSRGRCSSCARSFAQGIAAR